MYGFEYINNKRRVEQNIVIIELQTIGRNLRTERERAESRLRDKRGEMKSLFRRCETHKLPSLVKNPHLLRKTCILPNGK